MLVFFFFSSRRRHTRFDCDWSSDVCSSDLDVIVFAYPKNPELNYVKRVIGAPGDTVEMRSGEVRVNGRRVVEPYVQRVDPRDVYNPEFNWQRDYLVGGPAMAHDSRPIRNTLGALA